MVCRAIKAVGVAEAMLLLLHSVEFAAFLKFKMLNVERVLCLNCTKFDAALAWVLSNTPAKCDIDWDEWFSRYVKDVHTDRAEIPGFILDVKPTYIAPTTDNIRHIPLG